MSLTDVHTGRVMLLRALGTLPQSPPPAVSADGKFLVSVAMGRLFSLARPVQPANVPNALTFPTYTNLYLPDPFSDHDASLVVQSYPAYYPTPPATYSVQSVRTGRTTPLGIGDSGAAADPQVAGAFVAYARPSRVTPPGGAQPDIRLELRDAGARPRVLATSARIIHVLGIRPRYGVTLVPLPNPQGTMVAVAVQSIGGSGQGGIVVYSRGGRLLGFQSAGISGSPAVAWSRSGTSLAYLSQGSSGAELTRWEIGAQSTTSELQVPVSHVSECLWSPDDLSVLCGGGARGSWWISQSGTTYELAGNGVPLAWLGGGLGG
jgi:hypothetical protein